MALVAGVASKLAQRVGGQESRQDVQLSYLSGPDTGI